METHKKVSKHGLTPELAEGGLKAFPKNTDSRAPEFLAEEYHRRKRHDGAIALIWAGFVDFPSLSQYQN